MGNLVLLAHGRDRRRSEDLLTVLFWVSMIRAARMPRVESYSFLILWLPRVRHPSIATVGIPRRLASFISITTARRHRVTHKGDGLYRTRNTYVNDGALHRRRRRTTSRAH